MIERGAVFILGYGEGIGAALAAAFSAEGHPLALIARNEVKVVAAATAIQQSGRTAIGIPADAADEAMLSAALREASDALGPAQVLLYNAAHWRPGPLMETTPGSLVEDFRTDVVGALVAVRATAPAMIARGHGSLLFTGGGLALHPSAQAPSLSIGKAGLRALALMLAEELAPAGVRVGTVTIMGMVAPGTPFAAERVAEAFLALHSSPPDPKTAEVLIRG